MKSDANRQKRRQLKTSMAKGEIEANAVNIEDEWFATEKTANKLITTKCKKPESPSNIYDCLTSDDEEGETVYWREYYCRLENKQLEEHGGETHEQESESNEHRKKQEVLERDSEEDDEDERDCKEKFYQILKTQEQLEDCNVENYMKMHENKNIWIRKRRKIANWRVSVH